MEMEAVVWLLQFCDTGLTPLAELMQGANGHNKGSRYDFTKVLHNVPAPVAQARSARFQQYAQMHVFCA